MKFTVTDGDGRILRTGDCPEDQLQFQAGPDDNGHKVHEGEYSDTVYFYDVVEDSFRPLPERPSDNHRFNYATKTWVDQRTLDEVKSAQTSALDAAFEAAASALTAGYPPTERSTWFMQQSEALAWAEDNTHATPYLDGIAAARGIDPADMRAKTLENVRLFMGASQSLVGTRQGLRDAINAATTVPAVEAIVWVMPASPAPPPEDPAVVVANQIADAAVASASAIRDAALAAAAGDTTAIDAANAAYTTAFNAAEAARTTAIAAAVAAAATKKSTP